MDSFIRGYLEIRSRLDQIDAGLAARRNTPTMRHHMWSVLKQTVILLREIEDKMTEEELEGEPWQQIKRTMNDIFETLQSRRNDG